jgi:pyridoxine 5-phosphate synthase
LLPPIFKSLEEMIAIACIPGMEELNIGHTIISRAVLVGMERAVREMKLAMKGKF